MGQADFGDQALKAGAPLGCSARFAQILINDEHLGLGPAEREGAFDEAILEPRRLLMTRHLLDGGLADVYHRESIAMLPLNLAVLPEREGDSRRHSPGPPSRAPLRDGVRPSGPAG